MILRLQYVQKFKDRYGAWRYYLRRRGAKAIALPDRADPGFLAAYQAALAQSATKPQAARFAPRSLEALTRSYFDSPVFVQLRASTQANYRRLIMRLLRAHAEKPVVLLDPAGVRMIVHGLANTPSAANHTLRMIRTLMRHAIELGWCDVDPTRDVRRLKTRSEGPETWTEEDISAFEAHWPIGSKPRLALALLLYTGQRRSDVVRMGWQHIRGGAIEVRQVKTGARLLIPMHRALSAIIEREPRDRLTFLVTGEARSPKPYTPNGFYMRFSVWREAAGIVAGKSPHGLRKAAARRLAEEGCTAHQIAAVTGHKTLAEVQRYTIAADQVKLAEQAMKRVSGNKKRR